MKGSFIASLLNRKLTRKQFIKICVSALALLPFYNYFSREGRAAENSAFNGRPARLIKSDYDLVVAKGEDPYAITVKAVEAMGGMGRFVKKDSTVLIKPNMGWDRSPAQAGNTNPQVVAALVDLSFKAGAKRVNIFDITCNDPRRCYVSSEIEKTAKEHGANVYFPDQWDTIKANFGYPSKMEGWPILKDAVECDTFINVPILKHHSLAKLTMSMKNLMGVCGGDRGYIHRDMGEKLVDLTNFINPDLTIIDAYRVLVRNGPSGGNLADVKMLKTVVAATDSTLADTYGATLMEIDPMDIPNIRNAVERNIGSSDISKARTLTIEV